MPYIHTNVLRTHCYNEKLANGTTIDDKFSSRKLRKMAMTGIGSRVVNE